MTNNELNIEHILDNQFYDWLDMMDKAIKDYTNPNRGLYLIDTCEQKTFMYPALIQGDDFTNICPLLTKPQPLISKVNYNEIPF
jgi:hypothetical protein